MSHDVDSCVSCNDNLLESPVNGRQLRLDPELALPRSEIDKVSEAYCVENDIHVLMKKWRKYDGTADAEWAVYHQVVLPKSYRNGVLNVAHEKPLGGHFVRKTRIFSMFYGMENLFPGSFNVSYIF